MEVRTDENEMFPGNELAKSVWKGKYALGNETHYDQMHRRMAKEFYSVEEIYNEEEILPESVSNIPFLSGYGQNRDFLSEESIYELFKDFKYIVPQGSIMSQLGAESIGSLSNCFVIQSPEDSYGGIFRVDEEMAQLMKRRGGVGVDISTLRPKGTLTSNAAKSSTGPISFMPRFSNTTREVAQDGRRGALMLSISVNHPDILDFVRVKRDLMKVTGANISIKLSNKFMEAVKNEEDFLLQYPCNIDSKLFMPPMKDGVILEMDYGKSYRVGILDNTISSHHSAIGITKKINAKELWKEIIESAHGVAEPGLIFEDNHINYSPDGVYPQFRGVTTNPCGEIFMQPYDACRLIAVNLFSFVANPFTSDAYFDFNKYYKVNYEAMRLSDDLIDLEIGHIDRIIAKIVSDPEIGDVKQRELDLWVKIHNTAISSRRTGLGYTGLGDTLAALGVRYGSDKSLSVVEEIMSTKLSSELDCTVDLSILRGHFIGWDSDKESYRNDKGTLFGTNDFYEFLSNNFKEQFERMIKHGRRNVSFSTLAPTGTTSLMTMTTSGIEPMFMPFYKRRKKINPNDKNARVDFTDANGDTWQEYFVLHPKFKEWLYLQHESISIPKLDILSSELVSPETWGEDMLNQAFENSPWYNSTANDIDWSARVRIQSIIQDYTTHSISSTVNLPNDVSKEEVENIYMEAWNSGLKGITVYRDGSRDGVLISSNAPKTSEFVDVSAPKRPDKLECRVIRFQNNYDKWVAFIGLYDDRPYEIFTGESEAFTIPNNIENGYIIKRKLPSGNKSYDFVFEQDNEEMIVKGLSRAFKKEYWNYAKLISSMLRHGMPVYYVTQTIQDMTFDKDHINTWKYGVIRALKKFIANGTKVKSKCLECESDNIVFEEGCQKCLDCGSSKCG